MALLTCNGLSVGYGGHVVASGIDFAVEPGQLVCVIGENGTGKSTLVRTLLGLMEPLSGTVTLGEELATHGVGYLPQQGDVQRDFPAAAGEIVLSGRLAHLGRRLFYNAEDRRAADEALARVGAAHLRDHAFSELSGGQQQRVLLARALCAASRLIVLDEPTTGLDPEASHALYELLDTLCSDGLAVISVTHDVREALNHATHVLSLGGEEPRFETIAQHRAGQKEAAR